MKKGFNRLVRWCIALLLLPFLWAVLAQLLKMGPALVSEGYKVWWFYALGASAYLAVDILLQKPMWLYVFGHELTHVISGVLSGAKIHSFKAKSTGGEVKLSKSNTFIALSPYVVPLYALLLIGLYTLTRHWWNPPYLRPIFQFLLGGALAFHISLTISALHKHQSDLKLVGFFLSSVLILMGNGLIISMLGVALFTRTPTANVYFRGLSGDSGKAWGVTYRYGHSGLNTLIKFIKSKPWIR